MRSAVARATSTSPACSDAPTSCTLRPGRSTRVSTESGETGTGRRSSTVSRVTIVPSPPGTRSAQRASSAAGGGQ